MTVTVTTSLRSRYPDPPGVIVAITAVSEANYQLVTLIRTHPDGSQHRVITSDVPRLLPLSGSWIDYHAPFNQSITYTATLPNGHSGTSTPTRAPGSHVWFVGADPTKALRVEGVRGFGERIRATRATRFVPQGGSPIYLTEGTRDALVSSVTIRTSDLEDVEDRVLDNDSVVLFKTPGRNNGWDVGWCWVSLGDAVYVNPFGHNGRTFEWVTIPLFQAAEPRVDLVNVWTAGEAAAYWKLRGVNAGQLPTHYATAADYAIDNRQVP